jgi:hypothetical protein
MATNRGAFKKGEKRPNQGKRGPNKVTTDVRAAIAKLAEANVDRCQEWLDRIALVDPDKAFDLYLKMLEYHVPKLARAEITGKDGGPVVIAADALDQIA